MIGKRNADFTSALVDLSKDEVEINGQKASATTTVGGHAGKLFRLKCCKRIGGRLFLGRSLMTS